LIKILHKISPGEIDQCSLPKNPGFQLDLNRLPSSRPRLKILLLPGGSPAAATVTWLRQIYASLGHCGRLRHRLPPGHFLATSRRKAGSYLNKFVTLPGREDRRRRRLKVRPERRAGKIERLSIFPLKVG
jgi:hypothetical protein